MSQAFWAQMGAPTDKIVPMAGELGVSAPAEIDAYVQEAKVRGIADLHFYAFEDSVNEGVWSAIANA